MSQIFYQSESTAAARRVVLHLVDPLFGEPVTTETGGQPRISKNGAAPANTTAVLVAIDATKGDYYVELTATELDTRGHVTIEYVNDGVVVGWTETFPVLLSEPYFFVGKLIVPSRIEVPTTGTRTYKIEGLYTDNINEDLGNFLSGNVTLSVKDQAGTSLNARLTSTTPTYTSGGLGTPRYTWVYTSTAGDTPAELIFSAVAVYSNLGPYDDEILVEIASLESPASVDISALALETTTQSIKVKTDNLPSDPADESLIIAATNALAAAIAAIPSAPSATTIRDAILGYQYASGRSVLGWIRRAGASLEKTDGLTGTLTRFLTQAGAVIWSIAQDPTNGTRGVVDLGDTEDPP